MPEQKLGPTIRGARLGWHVSGKHGCMIRMSPEGGRFRIELSPINEVPITKTKTGTHYCWWDEPAILDKLPWLESIKQIHREISVLVGEDGKIIQ